MWDVHNDAAAPAITPGKSGQVFQKQLTHVGHCLGDALLYPHCHAELQP